jgi:hydrogenase maturation protease
MSMGAPGILIAGVGNIFLGDDAFGVEVVRRLAGRRVPEGVRVVDFGVRSLDLAYALLDGEHAATILESVTK